MKARIVRRSDGVELLRINDQSSDSGAHITGKIEGLGLPTVRVTRGAYSGRHGGFTGRRLWEPRLVTVSGVIIADTVAAIQDRRRNFNTAFSALDDLELHVEYENGSRYLVYCQLIGTPTLDYTPLDPLKPPYYIELIANDPTIYDATDSEALSATVNKAVGGGITWPVVWPRVSAAGSGSVTVDNNGTLDIYPRIVVTGSMTNPILINHTTGQLLALEGLTSAAGQLVIDMHEQVVTLDGGNVAPYLSAESDFWPLEPGSNTTGLTTSDAGDTASAVITWRNGYMGI